MVCRKDFIVFFAAKTKRFILFSYSLVVSLHGIRISESLMKNKYNRLSAIRVIIASEPISTQEDLLGRLHALGFDLTQATLSRDLKEIEVSKAIGADGESVYVLPESADHGQAAPLRDVPVSIGFSGNVAIVKTPSGYAGGIAGDIDRCGLESVLGTVAGDDTILVVVKEGYTQHDVLSQLVCVLPKMKRL